jgi:hypothetical protein
MRHDECNVSKHQGVAGARERYHLIRWNLLLPAASTIEQFISQVRAQAENLIFTQLTASLSVTQRKQLDALLKLGHDGHCWLIRRASNAIRLGRVSSKA